MARLIIAFIAAVSGLCAVATGSAQLIDSTFIGSSNYFWKEPANWYPKEVPNNAGTKQFSVTLRYFASVTLEGDATISGLTLQEKSALRVRNGQLTILGPLTNSASIGKDDEDDHGIVLENASLFVNSLTSFSNGALTGGYRLFYGSASAPTTFRFPGADIRELSGGLLSLEGPFTRIIDENGQDALRHFSVIGPDSRFNVNNRSFFTAGDFTNNGTLNVGILAVGDPIAGPTLFSATGKLTNFDPVTKTLQGGKYRVSSFGSDSDFILRFPGADIVNNGAVIYLEGAHARIVDESGNDALRHFAHNLAGASFEVSEGFTTAGDFTNDGIVHGRNGFKVSGKLTNFDAVNRRLTGGTYILSDGDFQVPGLDVVNNAASLVILWDRYHFVDENGANGLRNLANNLADGMIEVGEIGTLEVAGTFTNAGRVTLDGDTYRGVLRLPAAAQYHQVSGETFVRGTLVADTISIEGGTVTAHGGSLSGNLSVGNATFAADNQADLTGGLAMSADSRFRVTPSTSYYFSLHAGGASTAIGGTLDIVLDGGLPPASSDVFVLISSVAPITGTFSNAPPGARVATADGKGSFTITYNQHEIVLSAYQAVPAAAELLNISTRAQVLTGDNIVIAGFIVTGSVPKKIAARGIGPSLGQFGIAGVLNDPEIQLFNSSGAVIAANNDWKQSQAAEIQQAGLAPDIDREAALITTLSPGNYTIALRGLAQTTGVGVVEVYDLSTGSSRLANISTRARVGSEGNVLIAGFIGGGAGPGNAEVIVRGRGPDLEQYGVTGYLPDPTLELRDANGDLVAANDDYPEWSGSLQGYEPADYRSAALRVTLAAGGYTAIVRGKNGAEGVALVEVYDLNR
jgi:hypothetical protein